MINQVIAEMISYFNNDVRRINHALKVYGLAAMIAGLEKVTAKDELVISLAGVLHDIGIKEAERKYNSSAGNYQEIEGPAIARGILEQTRVEEDVIERVCFIIGHHHSYSKIAGLDFQILVEADFLVNIFEDNMEKKAILSISKKYFKTETGLKILRSMYF